VNLLNEVHWKWKSIWHFNWSVSYFSFVYRSSSLRMDAFFSCITRSSFSISCSRFFERNSSLFKSTSCRSFVNLWKEEFLKTRIELENCLPRLGKDTRWCWCLNTIRGRHIKKQKNPLTTNSLSFHRTSFVRSLSVSVVTLFQSIECKRKCTTVLSKQNWNKKKTLLIIISGFFENYLFLKRNFSSFEFCSALGSLFLEIK